MGTDATGTDIPDADAGNDIRMSAVTVDITPQGPVRLGGFETLRPTTDTVDRPIEVNLVELTLSGSERLLLVSTDSLYGGQLASGLSATTGVPRERILVMGSHTHFAPSVDSGVVGLGPTSPEYVRWIVERCAQALRAAPRRPGPKLSWRAGTCSGLIANRRRPTLGVGIPLPKVGRTVSAPHGRGFVDDTVRVATLEVEGVVTAVIWQMSCHPVVAPEPNVISPAFPGEVRNALRREYGSDVPVLFVQGFSGDLRENSASRRPPRRLRQFLYYCVAGGVRFGEQTPEDYASWCARLTERVMEIAREPAPKVPLEVASSRTELLPPGWSRPAAMHLVRLTRDLAVLGVNAEVVGCRVADLSSVIGCEVMPAGCCDESIGYWPTDAMRRRGGYEVVYSSQFFPALDWSKAEGADAVWSRLLRSLVG